MVTAVSIIDLGKSCTMTRRSYGIKEKHKIVQWIDDLISSGLSHHQACLYARILDLYYRWWKKLFKKVGDVNSTDNFMSYNTNGSSHTIHPCCKNSCCKLGWYQFYLPRPSRICMNYCRFLKTRGSAHCQRQIFLTIAVNIVFVCFQCSQYCYSVVNQWCYQFYSWRALRICTNHCWLPKTRWSTHCQRATPSAEKKRAH
jgi:hypothetical protein